jgi:hypothetical protein
VQRWVTGGLCARQCEDGDGQRRAGHQALARVRLGWLRGPLDACESTLGTGSRSRDGLVDLIVATPSSRGPPATPRGPSQGRMMRPSDRTLPGGVGHGSQDRLCR